MARVCFLFEATCHAQLPAALSDPQAPTNVTAIVHIGCSAERVQCRLRPSLYDCRSYAVPNASRISLSRDAVLTQLPVQAEIAYEVRHNTSNDMNCRVLLFITV